LNLEICQRMLDQRFLNQLKCRRISRKYARAGANIHMFNNYALFISITKNKIDDIVFLLENGANPNSLASKSLSLLSLSLRERRYRASYILIQYGAKLNNSEYHMQKSLEELEKRNARNAIVYHNNLLILIKESRVWK